MCRVTRRNIENCSNNKVLPSFARLNGSFKGPFNTVSRIRGCLAIKYGAELRSWDLLREAWAAAWAVAWAQAWAVALAVAVAVALAVVSEAQAWASEAQAWALEEQAWASGEQEQEQASQVSERL